MFDNYSFKIYSSSYSSQHSLVPTLYPWVNEKGIDKNEFIVWAFIEQNLSVDETIGVKLKDKNALIIMHPRRAKVYYTYSANVFEDHFDDEVIEFDNGIYDVDEILRLREEKETEKIRKEAIEEEFWDDPAGIVKNIQLNIVNLDNELKLKFKENNTFTDQISKVKSKIQYLNFKNSINDIDTEKAEKILLSNKKLSKNDINKMLNKFYIRYEAINKSIINVLEEKENTYFHSILKFKCENNSDFLHLIFSNFQLSGMFNIIYLYIMEQIIIGLNNESENVLEISKVIMILDKLKDKKNHSDLVNYIKLHEKNSLFTLVFKKMFYDEIKNYYLNTIQSMSDHINNGFYLVQNYTDRYFFKFYPSRNIEHFSRSKYSYLNLEFRIFKSILNLLSDCKNKDELLNKLKNKRRTIVLNIFYDFNESDRNATKHIMNLFNKNFGKETLYLIIERVLLEMNNYILNDYNKQLNSITIKKILNNKV